MISFRKLACAAGLIMVFAAIVASANAAQINSFNLRTSYQSIKLSAAPAPRQVIDLAGNWLFMPSQELNASAHPADPAFDDKSWHMIDVPQFWAPIIWASFLRYGQGSYNFQFRERARCDRYGFDYMKTQSGWYRQWFDVPQSLKGKRFIVRFTGVASVSQVYWNGKSVGGHVGMFGPFECEVTPYMKFGGRNLLSVFVSAGKTNDEAAKQVTAVAVTVDVTSNMLNNLPHGLYFDGPIGGIWQPAELIVSGADRISDVFFRPRLDGAAIETTINAKSKNRHKVRYTIADDKNGSILYKDAKGSKLAAGAAVIKSSINGLRPRLWSPEHPNLYKLKTQLFSNEKLVDESIITVGFRTFEVKGQKLYLNGKPYFLRGANDPPQGAAPSDKALANKFMKLMHDGNEMVTRFHGGPFGDTWLDAADTQGVGVSMQGQWPWVLIGGNPIPSADLLKAWKEDYTACVRAYRNHPSILIWTINNENYFTHGGDPDQKRKAEKYKIFSDIVKATRAIDPDKPVIFFSGYRRGPGDYENIIKPNNIDDGDIGDKHNYIGWYGKSLYQADIQAEFENDTAYENMPVISQEAAVPYMDVDTGHAIKNYQVKASAWVGKYAFYDTRPDRFLDVQAQIAKDYGEKIRRDRKRLAGLMLFCNGLWFKDAYDAGNITPFPVYWGVKTAWQPVLVSLESANRHFMVGEKFTSSIYVVNDDQDNPMLKNLALEWNIHGNSAEGTSGTASLPDCRFDSKCKQAVEFAIPAKLPGDKSDMVLELTLLQGREVVSRNSYPLICGTQEWCSMGADSGKLIVLESDGKTSEYLRNIGANCESTKSINWASVDSNTRAVIAPDVTKAQIDSDGFAMFVHSGGRALMLEPTQPDKASISDTTLAAIPGLPVDQFKIVPIWGDFIDVTPSELLDGLDPMDMHWLNSIDKNPVQVCRVGYQFPDGLADTTKLAKYTGPHAYIKESELSRYISWPVFEVNRGKGRVIVSSVVLADDPIAKRFLRNELLYLAR